MNLIASAFERADQLTPSMDVDETVPNHQAATQPSVGSRLSRCPSCFGDIESDPFLKSCSTCASCNTLVYVDDEATDLEDVPARLNTFVLTRRLGTGAFGQVWLAHDEQLDRDVAIKFPRAANISEEYRRLFLREARNVAQLRHPNIVSVYEVGDEDGLVYIVSEFVDSMPLDRWIKKNRLSFRETAILCIKISNALQAAHDRGVVHRDLKPSNILIDNDNEPHITDFGLSKRDSELRVVDSEGRVLGTPAYMSPEQASGKSDQSDGRSDVYSLGVMLFELVTGEKPFRGDPQMVMQQVMDEEPPAPRSLNANVPRDLETICLKCLAKKPAARYQTAARLSNDLLRWTENKPIQARPASGLERSLRWCQRNRLVTGLTAAVLVALLAGLAGVTWQWQKERTALADAELQRQRGDRLLDEANRVVDEFLLGVSTHDAMLKKNPGTAELRLQFLEKARSFYQSLIDLEGADRQNTRLVNAYTGSAGVAIELRKLPQAIADTKTGIEMAQDLVESGIDVRKNHQSLVSLTRIQGVALFQMHDFNASNQALQESIVLAREILEEDPSYTPAVNLLTGSLDLQGTIARQRLKPDVALQHYREAESMLAPLVDETPGNHDINYTNLATIRHNMAALLTQKDPGEAQQLNEQVLQMLDIRKDNQTWSDLGGIVLGQQSPHWAVAMGKALFLEANLRHRKRDLEGAAALQQEAVKFFEYVLRYDPHNVELLTDFALLQMDVGLTAKLQLKKREAMQAFEKATRILKPLYDRVPEDFVVKLKLAQILDLSSSAYFDFGDEDQAIQNLETALVARQELIETHPDIAGYHFAKAMTHGELGNFYVQMDQRDNARENYEASISIINSRHCAAIQSHRKQTMLANVYTGMAAVAHAEKDPAQELGFAKQVMELREQVFAANPTNRAAHRRYRNALSTLGLSYMSAAQNAQAVETFQECIDETTRHFSDVPDYQLLLGGDQVNVAICLRNLRRLDESLERSGQAVSNLQAMTERYPDHRQSGAFLRNAKACHAQTLHERAIALLQAQQTNDELEAVLNDMLQSCELTDWMNENYRNTLALALYRLEKTPGKETAEWRKQIPDKYRSAIDEEIQQLKQGSL